MIMKKLCDWLESGLEKLTQDSIYSMEETIMGKTEMTIETIKNSELPININDLITTMASVKPVMSFPHRRGIGKKCYIQVESKTDNFVIEFFTEALVPETPANRLTGYDSDDVKQYRGVMMTIYEEADADGYHPNYGEIISYDDFVTQYVTTSEMRIRLDRIMESMDDYVDVNDEFLETANNFWENRDIGTGSLFTGVLH